MIYKFIDNNESVITVNSLSSLQSLIDSGDIKKNTRVKAGLRGNWVTAKDIKELKFKEKKIEEVPKESEDIKSVITSEAASSTKKEENKNIKAPKVELKSTSVEKEIVKDSESSEVAEKDIQDINKSNNVKKDIEIEKGEKDETDISAEAKKKKEFFIKVLWRGDYPLGLTFWLFYQFPGLLVNIFAVAAEDAAFGNSATTGFLYFYTILLWAGIFYIILAMIGCWKSANKYREEKKSKNKPYGWAIAAQVLIVLGAISMVSGFLTEILNTT